MKSGHFFYNSVITPKKIILLLVLGNLVDYHSLGFARLSNDNMNHLHDYYDRFLFDFLLL